MDKEPPDLSLTHLHRLQEQLIAPDQHAISQQLFRDSISWQKWLKRFSGALGLLFLMAGVVFFYAANWTEMPPLVRLVSVQVLIAVAALAAIFLTRIRRYLLIAASLLTGVLLAVFGQVYQTGADAFEVYALWVVLIIPWVLIARSIGLWTLWLIVLQVAICLFGGQYLVPSGWAWEWIIASLGVINIIAVVIYECLYYHGLKEQPNPWFKPLFLAVGLAWLTMLPFRWIFEMHYLDRPSAVSLIWLLVVIATFAFYYQLLPYALGVGLALLSFTTAIVMTLARFVLESGFDDTMGWLFLAVVSLVIFGGAATMLIGIHRSIENRIEYELQKR